jgi:hypothetical protein
MDELEYLPSTANIVNVVHDFVHWIVPQKLRRLCHQTIHLNLVVYAVSKF